MDSPGGRAGTAPRQSPRHGDGPPAEGLVDRVRAITPLIAATVHYLDHELQRIHRDIHMIAAHTVFDVDLVAEGVGRELVRLLAEREAPEASQGGEP